MKNLKLGKFSYLTLWAVNFDELVAFYRDTLELPVEHENENSILFSTTGAKLAFHRLDDKAKLNRMTAEIHFEVENVDEACRSLELRCVLFIEEPVNRPWGVRQATFADPEGYRVELVGPLNPDEPTPEH